MICYHLSGHGNDSLLFITGFPYINFLFNYVIGFRETAQIGNTLKYRNSSEDMDLVSHIKISYRRIGFRETGHIGNTLTSNSSFYMELTIIRFISNDRLIIHRKRQIGKLLSNQEFRAQKFQS